MRGLAVLVRTAAARDALSKAAHTTFRARLWGAQCWVGRVGGDGGRVGRGRVRFSKFQSPGSGETTKETEKEGRGSSCSIWMISGNPMGRLGVLGIMVQWSNAGRNLLVWRSTRMMRADL